MNFCADFGLRTDLAAELITDETSLPKGIERTEENTPYGFVKEKITVSDEGSEFIGKPSGKYVTVNFGRIFDIEPDGFEYLAGVISEELKSFAETLSKRPLSEKTRVLVVGLGNEKMTPDSIGPECVSQIGVTHQLKKIRPELFRELGCCSLSAFSPGTMGQTGIETSDLVLGAVKCVEPNIVIAVDALAAFSAERLGSTVQISDTGIHPGSGVGNRRKGIDEKTLGVPVIALGVPTVVDSETLIREALEKAGIDCKKNDLEGAFENRKNYFVAPKECDAIVESAAKLLAYAIDSAFGINFN